MMSYIQNIEDSENANRKYWLSLKNWYIRAAKDDLHFYSLAECYSEKHYTENK
jgi:hypothetical protein